MKTTQYGLTDAGFVIKPLAVILEEEKEAFRKAFGDDVDLSGESVAGAYVGNQAAKLAALWEQLEGLWVAGDRDSAGGIFLDRLAAFVNVEREQAKSTSVTACIWGSEETAVPKGAFAKLSTTGDLFYLLRAVTVTKEKLLGLEMEVVELEAASLTIDGYALNFEPDGAEEKEDYRDRIISEIENVFDEKLNVSAIEGSGIRIVATDGVTSFSVDVSGGIEASLFGAPAEFAAKESGRIYVPSGTLSEMVSNVSGVDKITNYATGNTGRGAESDTELRTSMVTRQRKAKCTDQAIENSLSVLAGVTYARVYSNRDIVSVNGRPPKSFESVVIGGERKEIAHAIFSNMPAGIQPFGNTSEIVRDSQGFDWDIGFSRPVNRNIWVKVVLTLYDEEEFPKNGASVVCDNILHWSDSNLGVAADVIFQRLMKPIYTVPGIAHADIKIASTADPDAAPDDSEYKAENIAIGEVEIAVFDTGRISVEVAQ